MSKQSKFYSLDKEIQIYYAGISDCVPTDKYGDSWTRTITIRRHTEELPKNYLNYCWQCVDNYDIKRMKGEAENWTKKDDLLWDFITDLWEHLFEQLRKNWNVSILSVSGNVNPGQRFTRMPVMWIYKNHIVIEQDGGLDI